MSIAVSASTGQLGKVVVDLLVKRNAPVVALARDTSKVPAGVEARKFDYKSDAATLAASLAGVKTLIIISSNDFNDRFGQHKAAVDAAKHAGVTTVLYTSLLRAPTTELGISTDHKATEEYIAASGLKYVFLRNGWYLENWTGQLAPALAHGAIPNAIGGGKVSPATRLDFAEAAVAAAILANEGKPVKTAYELGGETITIDDLAAEVSVHAGKTVVSAAVPKDVYAKQLEGFGLPAPVAGLFAQCDDAASRGGLYVEKTDLVELIGHEPYSWKLHVKEAVAAATAAK
ncbi:hypothetical protein DFJ73DRAFT_656839 [Zopfochytrium polystomum]|nr:hypothetical protein DFJ73DRAFT_656839 [Zopfochytrium polystomum]